MKEWLHAFLVVAVSLMLAVLSTWGVYTLSGRPFEAYAAAILCMSWLAGYAQLWAVLSSYTKDADKSDFVAFIVIAMMLPICCSVMAFC